MNVLIQKISNEAYSKASEKARPTSPEFDGFYTKLFAESLIRECALVCMQKHYEIINSDSEVYSGDISFREFWRGVKTGRKLMASTCASSILDNFGVKL